MRFFDPHIHMTSRTTDDLEAMSDAGVRAVIEPAFWLGQPRTQAARSSTTTRASSAGNVSAPRSSASRTTARSG
jgi:predicted metal-dependent TIM-barrel fold hydrolase